MSELDIELQKQTADVSITEMKKEADDMQKTLNLNGKEIEDESKGELKDGK